MYNMKIFAAIIASALAATTAVVHAKQQEAAANGYPLVKAATANGDARNGRVLQAKGDKGQGDGGDSKTAKGGKADSAKFPYGVASGDPLADAVIIWTAVKGKGTLTWHVSEDVNFLSIVKSGQVTANSANGHTAKVDVTGLSPGSEYYYRFKMGSSYYSPVGQTRTLPEGDVNEVKLAVFSCANYPGGYFHAYKEAVTRGAKFAVFLGDYIYGYEAGGYASDQAAAMGRKSDPAVEVTKLDHYRRRHAQYKSDQDAQLMHAAMPMIAVWDDNEVADGSYRDGATNHDPSSEGSWEVRKAAAIQAYHEWMPIRTGPSKEIIYRSFDFGTLLSLHMLDTRLVGTRDKVGEYTDIEDLFSPTRTMLGKDQFNWLDAKLTNSPGQWQILGQQVLMARMEFPVSILQFLVQFAGATDLQGMYKAFTAYVTAKGTPEADRTPEQRDLLDPTLNPKFGYNLDAWDGYPIERELLLTSVYKRLLSTDRKLVVLAGDTHNAWHADITTGGYLAADEGGLAADIKVGTMLATSSVSSPGFFEEAYAEVSPDQVAGLFYGVVDDLKWMDASKRGFLMLTVIPAEIKADWVFVTSVIEKDFTSDIGHTATVPFVGTLFN